jgi:voltage-gated potassium channel
LHLWLNHPAADLAVAGLILLSVGLLLVEIFLSDAHAAFEPVETAGHALTGVFAVELVLRFLAMPSRRRFFALYWLDVLAVLPLLRPFRLLRVLRLLRLLRLGNILNRRMGVLGGSLRPVRFELLALFSMLVIVVLVGAIGLHLAERSQAREHQSLAETFWWSVYSLVAVQPEPGVPETALGRTVMLLVMLCGVGLLATFTGIVAASMVNRLRGRMEERDMSLEELSGHMVVCGWNRMGYQVLSQLRADPELARLYVVLVIESAEPPRPLPIPAEQFFLVSGDFTRVETLRQAGIERAARAILLADKTVARTDQDRDARTVLAALTIEKLNRDILTCVELLNRENQSHLGLAGVEEVIVPDEYGGKILALAARHRGLVMLLDEVLTQERGNNLHAVLLPPAWAGKDVAFAHMELVRRHGALLLGLEREDSGGARRVWANPPATEPLRAGDRLLLLARGSTVVLGEEG